MSTAPAPIEFRKSENLNPNKNDEMTGDQKLLLKKSRVTINKVLAMKCFTIAQRVIAINKARKIYDFVNGLLEENKCSLFEAKHQELLNALVDLRDYMQSAM